VTAAAPPVAADQATPRPIPSALLGACLVLIGVGLVTFLVGLTTDADDAWRAYHVNYLFWGALGQGGLIVACTFNIVGARWTGPIRRLAEGLGAWVPMSVVLFAVSALGRSHIYGPWLGHPPAAKASWLTWTRMFWMDLGILVLLAGLSTNYLYHSIRPTLGAQAQGATGPAAGLFRWWTAGWRGEAAERERGEARCRRLAPILCLVYAFGFSFIAFDQVMSLTPTWYSNLFGAYFAWGGYLSGTAAVALLCVLHRNAPGLEGEITRARMHDLGKMIFAFSIFWMYLFFSQYLVIWYGNVPEETQFIGARLGSQFLVDKSHLNQVFLVQTLGLHWFWERLREPYAKVTLLAWICCWLTPFWVLLGQRPKKTPAILGTVAAVVVAGFWLERNVLVWPSLVPKDSTSFLGFVQLGVAAGFLGAFALVYLIFTRVVPSLAVPRRS
jgi:hypothetical protein